MIKILLDHRLSKRQLKQARAASNNNNNNFNEAGSVSAPGEMQTDIIHSPVVGSDIVPEMDPPEWTSMFNRILQSLNGINSNMKVMRKDLKQDMEVMRKDLKQDMEAMKQDMKAMRKDLKHDMDQMRKDFKQDMDQLKKEFTNALGKIEGKNQLDFCFALTVITESLKEARADLSAHYELSVRKISLK